MRTTRRLTRRSFVCVSGGALLAAPALLRPRPALAALAGQPFRQPPLDEGRLAGGLRSFDLKAAPGTWEFLSGVETPTIGINGPFLGPILSARAGDRLRMNVTNGLEEGMALHWHGLHLPAAMDGGPHQEIAPGATWSPEFTLMQKAATFWYHGHRHHRTGAHVWAGMAGVIRVADDEADALRLPRSHGEDDFTLVLQDRRFDASGAMPYAPNMHDLMAGLIGDVLLVNGQAAPVLDADAPLVRLRVLNGANGSIYDLHFADGRTFRQIGSDGGLLEAPVAMTRAMLAPGERAEFLVDLSSGDPAELLAETFGAEAPIMGSAGVRTVMTIRPGRPRPAVTLPERLVTLPPPPEATGETRPLKLSMSGEGMMGSFLINGKSFDPGRIDFSVPLGATETWVIENTTPMLHPIHIHDVQFRILKRGEKPPLPQDAGLKDVVLVHPGERVELRLAFADFADEVVPYMFHCHILEHEDAGMMGQFTVV